MGTPSEERDRGRSHRDRSRSRERDRERSKHDKKHDRKDRDKKDRDKSPSRKHKDRSPSRKEHDRRRDRSRDRERKRRSRSRERSRSRSGGRKRRRDEGAAAPAPAPGPAPAPTDVAMDIAARISARLGGGLPLAAPESKAMEPATMAAPTLPASIAPTAPAPPTTTTTTTPATTTSATSATGGVDLLSLDPVQAELEMRRRAERARQFQMQKRQTQTTTGLSGFMARPKTKGWSLEDENDEEEAQPAAMSAAAAVAAAINRSFMVTPADQKDKETPGYSERMEVADDVDPLDAFMSTLQKGAPVVERSSTYGALGAGDDVMQQNGRKFDPVGSMVITAADLIGGKSNKAGWESDTDAEDDGDDMESEDEEDARKFMEELRKKQGGPREQDKAVTAPTMDASDDKESVASGGADKGKAKDMGRIFGGDGDVMEEEEREKQEKAQNEIQAEAAKKKELKPVDHDKIDYLPFKKKLYIVPRALHELTNDEVIARRDKLEIKVRGKGCPAPIENWTQTGLSDRVLKILEKLEMKEPFPIQKQALPAIMAGRDMIGVAKTGSGKTLAFLLPLFRHILVQEGEHPLREGEGPIGLIMAPARELVVQIYREAKKFAKGLGLRVCAVYGGAGIADQIGELKRGAHIVVCSPGRMIDILTMQAGKVVSLQRVTYVVLDEADRMFDMGFEPQIRSIIQNVRPDRQTVLFSATFPKAVEGLARRVLRFPLEIVIGGRSVASETIRQIVEVHDEHDKFIRLLQLLGVWYEKGNVLIFVDTQNKCDSLFAEIIKSGYPCISLHGGMDQMDRDQTISDFKKKVATLMVATSVAGRGLDVPDLVCVINYNCPNHLEDYVHRVGRTGRAGRKGTAYTFLEPTEEQFAPFILQALQEAKQQVPDEIRTMAESFNAKVDAGQVKKLSSGFGGTGFKFDESEKTAEQKAEAAAKRQYEIEAGYSVEDQGEASDDEEANVPAGQQVPPVPPQAAAIVPAPVPPAIPAPVAPAPAPEPPSNIHPDVAAALKALQTSGVAPAPPPDAAEKIRQIQALFNPGGSNSLMPSTAGPMGAAGGGGKPSGPVSVEEAKRKMAEIAAKFGGGAQKKPADDTPHFEEELEINDYPQQARWKVTHRETMNAVNELTGCAVISRGQYFPPGKEPEPGSNIRKLYLFIEGDSEVAVGAARRELLRILNEEATRASSRPGGGGFSGGKYSIL